MQSSQVPSKTASGRTSTSHSRAHSPSSMASSPQHPGRGRQLPVDVRGTQAPEQQQQQQSPQGNSPRAYTDMAYPPLFLTARFPETSMRSGIYRVSQPSTQTYMPQQPPAPAHPPPQPPTHYPPALQLNPTHSQQPYASSVSPYPQPYPLHTPSDRYGPAPTQPLPPGWAAPEHYVYPYGYPPYAQPHPIMYWPKQSAFRHEARRARNVSVISTGATTSADRAAASRIRGHGAPSGGEEPATHPALPPPTMIARPPPPQESDAVAGYRAVKPILDAGWEESTRGRRDMIFGSVGAPGGSKSPSPSPQPRSEAHPAAIDNQPMNEKPERAVATFSIGVSPGEAGPAHVRSRTRSQPRLSRAENLSDSEPHVAAEVKVIDLTSPETKWEFGTANRPQDDQSGTELAEPQFLLHAPPAPSKAALDVSLLFSGPLQESMLPIVPTEPPSAESHHPYPQPHHHLSYTLPQQIHPPPPPPSQEDLQVQTGPGPYAVHQPPPQPLSSSSADGFEVKDFGYGFGRASGTAHAVASMREDRIMREREWERNRDPEREPYGFRPRRGSYGGHHERGGYNGRRGRGANGFGRGVSGRGFGRGGFGHRHTIGTNTNPSSSSTSSSSNNNNNIQHQPQQQQPQQQQAPPFTATTPSQAFQPLQPPTPPPRSAADVSQGQYLATAIQQPYMPHGFDAYQGPVPLSYPPPPNASMTSSVSVHPVPRPLSNITYSADPTRFFLLGQLEYYLSAQNMASDLFLRQRVIALFYRSV
jgi:la-related protein 1